MVHNDELAQRRSERNAFSRTNKSLTNDAEQIGIAGEQALANLLGIEHTPASFAPTKGYQFNLGPNKKIKILTSRTPGNLFVKEGKIHADVYVLAGITGDAVMENVYFVGWTHAGEVRKAPVTTPTRKGDYIQPAHTVHRDNLINMKGILAAFDRNPDNVHRFPLAENGDYVVTEPVRDNHKPATRPTADQPSFKPLPLRLPKSSK